MNSSLENSEGAEFDLPCGEMPEVGTPPSTQMTPRYRYADLSRAGREVLIEHEGQMYRLRTTRNGKLILNK
ncbi:hemin uptake protein HemP [Schlesneria sp.]|uniref:hemin uptake protein HemP n=1 Tax=Schlesneria sp. TaxID=2762018 RepID=UPI002EDDC10A